MKDTKIRFWDEDSKKYSYGFSGFSVDFWIPEYSTGLKDKNERPIFEGDVIEYEGQLYSVFYNKPTMQYGIIGNGFPIYGDKIKKKDLYTVDAVVVSNIHENS